MCQPIRSRHYLRVPRPTAQHPGDAADAGGALLVAEPVPDQPLPDLPAEDARVVLLVFLDLVFYFRCGNTWLAAANDPGPDTSGLLIPSIRHLA